VRRAISSRAHRLLGRGHAQVLVGAGDVAFGFEFQSRVSVGYGPLPTLDPAGALRALDERTRGLRAAIEELGDRLAGETGASAVLHAELAARLDAESEQRKEQAQTIATSGLRLAAVGLGVTILGVAAQAVGAVAR
jgi:hypothetical protein